MKGKALMKTSWIISCGQKRIMYQKYAYTKCNNAKEHYYSVKQRLYAHTHYNRGLDKRKCVKGFHKTAVHSQHLSRIPSRRARTKYNCEKEKIKKGEKHKGTDPFHCCDVFERFWRRLNLWVVCSPGAIRAIVTGDPIWQAAGSWNQQSSFHERSEHIC